MANPPPGAIFSTDLSFDVTISFGSYMIQVVFQSAPNTIAVYIVAMYLIPGSRKEKSMEIVRAFSSVIPPTNQLEAFLFTGR